MTSPASSPLDFINVSRLEAEFAELMRIPSLDGTPAEVEAQRWVADVFAADGFEVTTWDVDVPSTIAHPEFPGQEVERTAGLGALAVLPGSGKRSDQNTGKRSDQSTGKRSDQKTGGKTLLINGHTDVVPVGDPAQWTVDPFGGELGEVDGERVMFGRGACDMKAGVIAGIVAMRAIKESGVQLTGDVAMIPVFGEEDGGFGTFSALQHGVSADACIITEPTALDIIPANGGALTFRLSVHGLNAHASMRTMGVSAIEKFQVLHQALIEFESQRNAKVDPVMDPWPLAYPLNIGTVSSGDWASTVPDLLVANGRLGVALGETNAEARAALEATIAEACAADPFLAEHPAKVEWWGGQFASGQTPTDHPLVQQVRRVHAADTGSEPAVYGGPYGSDLRLMVGAGIPTLQYGPGRPAQAHAPDEYARISEVVQCARTLVQVILEFCK